MFTIVCALLTCLAVCQAEDQLAGVHDAAATASGSQLRREGRGLFDGDIPFLKAIADFFTGDDKPWKRKGKRPLYTRPEYKPYGYLADIYGNGEEPFFTRRQEGGDTQALPPYIYRAQSDAQIPVVGYRPSALHRVLVPPPPSVGQDQTYTAGWQRDPSGFISQDTPIRYSQPDVSNSVFVEKVDQVASPYTTVSYPTYPTTTPPGYTTHLVYSSEANPAYEESLSNLASNLIDSFNPTPGSNYQPLRKSRPVPPDFLPEFPAGPQPTRWALRNTRPSTNAITVHSDYQTPLVSASESYPTVVSSSHQLGPFDQTLAEDKFSFLFKKKNQLPKKFLSSPQEGNMVHDAFQPIFVPSQSLDEPKGDVMRPIHIPTNRFSSTSSSKPLQIQDFFDNMGLPE